MINLNADRKMYIFVTAGIYVMGGMQTYVAAKSKYLRENNWTVKVIYVGYNKGKTRFKELNRHTDGGVIELTLPPFKHIKSVVHKTLYRIDSIIGDYSGYETIIIESHDDKTSQWGELIAKRISAKHIVVPLNECYRGKKVYYEDMIDYYLFKFQRKELVGLETLQKLFKGYKIIEKKDMIDFLFDEDPVQEDENFYISSSKKYDYTICYIGRCSKPYVPNIIRDIIKFASDHTDKLIRFVVVGDTSQVKEFLDVDACNNLDLFKLGELVPIPRQLFSVIDVIIAGSGCARSSVAEGCLCIVADPESCQSIGLLGYETKSSVYWDGVSPKTSFSDALERTLIKESYKDQEFEYPIITVEEATMQNFDVIMKSAQNQEYYDERKLIGNRILPDFLSYFKFFLINHFPRLVSLYLDRRNA